MKPGDIVSFNTSKGNRSLFGIHGELVTLHSTATTSVVKTKHPLFYDEPKGKKEYLYDVSTEGLRLIKSKPSNVFTQEGTIMRPKDYLESGRVVFFRNGGRGIVVSLKGVNFIMIKNKLVPLRNFDKDLRYQFFEEYDIVKIAEMKEECPFEYFYTAREEMLDIIWQENFYTIDID